MIDALFAVGIVFVALSLAFYLIGATLFWAAETVAMKLRHHRKKRNERIR